MHFWWGLIDQGRVDEGESSSTTPRRTLFVCGILSSLVYVLADVLGAMRFAGYSYTSQAISELAAIGSPVRALVNPLFILYDILLIAFGLGVWESTSRMRSLRFTAALLIAIGVVGLAGPFVPMHQREVLAAGGETLTDTLHIILTSAIVLFILLAIGFGATAFGKWFRRYSFVTILILVVFGALAAVDGPRLETGEPTPWLGVVERISVYGYLLWVAVLAAVHLPARTERPSASKRSSNIAA